MVKIGAGGVAQRVPARAALAEDRGSLLSAHVRWLTKACNFCFKRSNASAGLQGHTHARTQIFKKQIIKIVKMTNFLLYFFSKTGLLYIVLAVLELTL